MAKIKNGNEGDLRGLISIFFKKYVRIWSVGEGGSRKASVARLLQMRPGLSQPVRVTLSHASPFKGVAAATRREVGDASSPSSAPCLRIKVVPPEPQDHDSLLPGLPFSVRGLRMA